MGLSDDAMVRVPAERSATETWVRASTIVGVDVVEMSQEEGWEIAVHQVVGNHERTLTVVVKHIDEANEIRGRLLYGALGVADRFVPAVDRDCSLVTTVTQPFNYEGS